MTPRKQVFERSSLVDFVVLQPVRKGAAKGADKVQIFGLNDVLSQIADTVSTATFTKP